MTCLALQSCRVHAGPRQVRLREWLATCGSNYTKSHCSNYCFPCRRRSSPQRASTHRVHWFTHDLCRTGMLNASWNRTVQCVPAIPGCATLLSTHGDQYKIGDALADPSTSALDHQSDRFAKPTTGQRPQSLIRCNVSFFCTLLLRLHGHV